MNNSYENHWNHNHLFSMAYFQEENSQFLPTDWPLKSYNQINQDQYQCILGIINYDDLINNNTNFTSRNHYEKRIKPEL